MDNIKNKQSEKTLERRNFIKKAVYVAPAILTMAAAPSFASSGSGGHPLIKSNKRGK